jgi:hypothetical protein
MWREVSTTKPFQITEMRIPSALILDNLVQLGFVWRSIPVSGREGCMSRKLAWVEGQGVKGWEGCTECAWVFIPSAPPLGESLNERARNLDVQLSEEFAAHDCAEHPRVNTAKAS